MLTVKQLIKRLDRYPGDCPVEISFIVPVEVVWFGRDMKYYLGVEKVRHRSTVDKNVRPYRKKFCDYVSIILKEV